MGVVPISDAEDVTVNQVNPTHVGVVLLAYVKKFWFFTVNPTHVGVVLYIER